MPAALPFNYMQTTNARGAFTTNTEGGVQGVMLDDPAVRFALRTGVVDTTETIPMWGGVGVYEKIPNLAAGNPDEHLGSLLGRATTLTGSSAAGLSGFSLFNQAYNMPITPQSPVPLAASGMTISYVRLGSGARLWVACDPSLVSLEGGVVGQQVSWDFNNQVLQPYDAATPTFAITSITWASTAGGRGTVVAGVATPVAAVGDRVNISGATNTGTGGTAAVNGNFLVDTFTDNQHFTIAMPAAAGVIGTIAGTILANYGTGALACRVDRVLPGNSLTVIYDPVTGYASWNYSGTVAQITI